MEIIPSLTICNGKYGPISKGTRGTIVCFASTGRVGVSFFNFTLGHNCNSSALDGTGLYLKRADIQLSEKRIDDDFAELVRICE